MSYRNVVIGVLFVLGVVASLPTVAESSSGEMEVVELGAVNRTVLRENGEVTIMTSNTFQTEEDIYQASVTFRNEEDLARTLELGIETIDLADLAYSFYLDDQGDLIQNEAGSGSLVEIAGSAGGTLCSDVVVRGTKELSEGLWVGVSLHSGGIGFQQQEGAEVKADVFGDCPHFALFGCSSACTTVTRDVVGGVTVSHKTCRPTAVDGGLDTCLCGW